MKALVGAFNQEKALIGAFSVIVKTGCGTDGSICGTTLHRSDRELAAGYPVDIIYLPQFIGTDIQDPGLVGNDGAWVVPLYGRKYRRCTGAKLCLS